MDFIICVSFMCFISISCTVGNKGNRRIWKRVFQENKTRQIFRKTNISYSLIRTSTCAYQGVRNVHFLENLACFVFLKHPFWDSPFCLITDELWSGSKEMKANLKGSKFLESINVMKKSNAISRFLQNEKINQLKPLTMWKYARSSQRRCS